MISQAFIAALILVESSGNDGAIGDNCKALGPLQIHAEVVEDVNRIYHTQYTHRDMFARAKAIQVCQLYLQHYAGKNPSLKRLAQTWNGGPHGHMNPKTLAYWHKVEKAMKVMAT